MAGQISLETSGLLAKIFTRNAPSPGSAWSRVAVTVASAAGGS